MTMVHSHGMNGCHASFIALLRLCRFLRVTAASSLVCRFQVNVCGTEHVSSSFMWQAHSSVCQYQRAVDFPAARQNQCMGAMLCTSHSDISHCTWRNHARLSPR